MIFCDDSGWGSLIGGVAIGLYDNESNKFYHGLISIKYFQGSLFKTGKYRRESMKIFRKFISRIDDRSGVTICRGTCLDSIWDYVESGYSGFRMIDRKKIGDPLQSLLEQYFAKHLKRCGVVAKSSGAHCLSFDDQLKWIREDPKRIKYVKTGWPAWQNKYFK